MDWPTATRKVPRSAKTSARPVSTCSSGQLEDQSSLTLNYGLRWELDTPLTDVLHHVQTFRPGQNSTVYPCQLTAREQTSFGVSTCAEAGVEPTGLVVPGDAGVQPVDADVLQGFRTKNWHRLQPELHHGVLGTLFGANGKTSIRSGWGLFYNPMEQLVLEQFGAEPPFGGSTYLPATFFNTPFICKWNRESQPVQRHPQSHAGHASGLVELPADVAVRGFPTQDADAVHRAIQLYDSARIGPRHRVADWAMSAHKDIACWRHTTLIAANPQTCLDIAARSRKHTHFNRSLLLRCSSYLRTVS